MMPKRLSALADAGNVSLGKAASVGRQGTWTSLSSSGRAAFQEQVKALETLGASVVSGQPIEGEAKRRA